MGMQGVLYIRFPTVSSASLRSILVEERRCLQQNAGKSPCLTHSGVLVKEIFDADQTEEGPQSL